MKASVLKIDLFSYILGLYFLTLHSDRLGIELAGFNVRVNNLIAFILLAMFVIRFRDHLFIFGKDLVNPLLVITCSILISLMLSSYPLRCLIFFCWFLITVTCYMILPYLIMKVLDPYRVFSLYCLSFVLVGIYALLQLIFSLIGWDDPFAVQRIVEGVVRPNALAYEPSFYALYMTPFVVMCNFHYLTTPNLPFFCFKNLNLPKISFFNFMFLVSTSTSAFFVYVLFIFSFIFIPGFKEFRKRAFQFFVCLTAMTALFCACFPFIMKTFFLKFYFHGLLSHHSFFERWAGISNAWTVFKQFPLFGVGLGGYTSLLKDAWLSGDGNYIFFSKMLLERSTEANFYKLFEPSNVFTELLASLGIVGLGAFFYLFVIFVRLARKAYSHAPLMIANLVLSVVIMMIVLQFNQGLLRTYIWVHFSFVFAFIERLSLGHCDKHFCTSSSDRVTALS